MHAASSQFRCSAELSDFLASGKIAVTCTQSAIYLISSHSTGTMPLELPAKTKKKEKITSAFSTVHKCCGSSVISNSFPSTFNELFTLLGRCCCR